MAKMVAVVWLSTIWTDLYKRKTNLMLILRWVSLKLCVICTSRNIKTKTQNVDVMSPVTISEWELVQMSSRALTNCKQTVCKRELITTVPKEVEHLMVTDMILIRRALWLNSFEMPQSQNRMALKCVCTLFLFVCVVNFRQKIGPVFLSQQSFGSLLFF